MGLLEQLSAWLGRGPRGAPVSVLVLGLDNSGKSTLLRALRAPEGGDAAAGAGAGALEPVAPTVGEEQSSFTSGGVSYSAWDVSGARRLRPLWERHYREADALVFVVDAADHLRIVVAREELELATRHPELAARRVPLLVFANKSDEPRALPPHQLAAALGLERVVDRAWHVCSCSALSGAGVRAGVAWLARELRRAPQS